MIALTKGQKVFGEQKLSVVAPTGEYADADLIECADTATGEVPGVFQAQYVKYGSVVYQHNTPEELGAALFAIDPESSHDAVMLYKEDEARRLARTKGTLEPSDPVPAPDALEETPPTIPEEEEDDVKFFREQAEEQASSTPEVVEEVPVAPELPVIDAGTPDVVIPEPEPMPTSTPAVIEEVPVPPAVEVVVPVEEVPAVDLSSTTPE